MTKTTPFLVVKEATVSISGGNLTAKANYEISSSEGHYAVERVVWVSTVAPDEDLLNRLAERKGAIYIFVLQQDPIRQQIGIIVF